METETLVHGPGAAIEANRRGAERHASLMRAAKIVCECSEYVVIIRDVSATGVSLRLFHDFPASGSSELSLVLSNGDRYPLDLRRTERHQIACTFAGPPVDVGSLIKEVWKYPRRPLRLRLRATAQVATLSGRTAALVVNLSQQGARIETDGMLANDQAVTLSGPMLACVRAKVRWRDGRRYGLVFEDTFRLAEFAVLAQRLQRPHAVRRAS